MARIFFGEKLLYLVWLFQITTVHNYLHFFVVFLVLVVCEDNQDFFLKKLLYLIVNWVDGDLLIGVVDRSSQFFLNSFFHKYCRNLIKVVIFSIDN